LPAPEAPTMAVVFPAGARKETSRNTGVSPNSKLMFLNSISPNFFLIRREINIY